MDTKTLPQLFTGQVERNPHQVALVFAPPGAQAGEVHITYRELAYRAEGMALYLKEQGIGENQPVAISLERSIELIVAILGILAAGGCYVPLNPKAPEARNRFILADTGAEIIISSQTVGANCNSPLRETAPLPSVGEGVGVRGADLAYIIYTSGSTGQPKGVPISHENLFPLLQWGVEHLGLTPTDRTLQNLSYYFDWSVWEIFITLISGSTLFIVSEDVLLNPEAAATFIHKHAITALHATPTQYRHLLGQEPHFPSLKYLFIGAEKFPLELLRRIRPSVTEECRIFNMYGPTEATIIAAVLEVERDGEEKFRTLSSVPIGTAVDNTALLVLDDEMRPCPENTPGELYIAGQGLSRGYLNNPELTAEKFVGADIPIGAGLSQQSPSLPAKTVLSFACGFTNCGLSAIRFSMPVQGIAAATRSGTAPLHGGEGMGVRLDRLYKTGDLCRRLADGAIEFFGRADFQVKIRGQRIEQGEIESHLLSHTQVREAVVTTRTDDSGEPYLCAFIVPLADVDPQALRPFFQELKHFLSLRLPDYMVPSHFAVIRQIPLNPNGKVDLRALPEARPVGAGTEYAPARNDIERGLIAIWAAVLGAEERFIGIDDDFFELGGHSLRLALAAMEIHKRFQVRLSLTDLFVLATIRALANHIENARQDAYIAIEKSEKKEYYPLSSAQKRLFILDQLMPGSTAYNITLVYRLQPTPNRQRLEKALRKLIDRHQGLRTSFILVDDEPVQRVLERVEFELEVFRADGRCGQELIDSTIRGFIRPFDLGRAPVVRALWLESTDGPPLLVLDMHHIVSDGTSVQILKQELLGFYESASLPSLADKVQYTDYTRWQQNEKGQDRMKSQAEFWLKEFAGEIPLLNLPLDFPRPPVQSFSGHALRFDIDHLQTRALKQLANQQRATLFMVLLTSFYILVSRLSGQEDIVVGTPTSGRRHPDLEHIVGMFVNTLPLRNTVSGNDRFIDLLAKIKRKTLLAFENQDVQFEEVVERLGLSRQAGRNPLFDVMFVLQNMEEAALSDQKLVLYPEPFHTGTAKFDLVMIAEEQESAISVEWEYSTDLFTRETSRRFTGYFKRIVAAVSADPGQKIADIDIMDEEERRRILTGMNGWAGHYERDKTLAELFDAQVQKNPDRPALVGARGVEQSDITITYRELDRQAGALAHELVKQGVRGNDRVAIRMERSLDMMIGILGILKTGSAYVPLNPKAPEARNRFILADTGAEIIISSQTVGANCNSPLRETAPLPYVGEGVGVRGADLTYIIYTSGSTGNPKGVPIRHSNLSPLLHWGYRHLNLGQRDRTIQNLSYYFDWSVWEIFITLTSGACLYPVAEEIMLNADSAAGFLQKHDITVLHATPSQFRYLIAPECRLDTLTHLFLGAEKLDHDLVKRSFRAIGDDCRLFNMYGPTEATIIAAVLEIERHDHERYGLLASVPIGFPAGNTQLLVLDRYLHLCPIRVTGELAIGGDGVAQGYLNNPELTAEKFVSSPLPSVGEGMGVRGEHPTALHSPLTTHLYKTGDLARFLEDGAIEFLGRIDNQVKIRGFRIEPGEIENRILKHPGVKEVVVIDREGGTGGEKYLCAYFIPKSPAPGVQVQPQELHRFLSGSLPDYMIPAFFIPIHQIPLNANGKVDRKSLPEPGRAETGRSYTPPRDDIDRRLVALWSAVLAKDQERIGIDDNFFQSGGHSLIGTILLARIHKAFAHRLSLADLFKSPTIRGLSALLPSGSNETLTTVAVAEKKEYFALSSAQRRLYILNQMEAEGIGYNIPVVYRLSNQPDRQGLEQAFRELIARHESFRTSFVINRDEPVQRIHPIEKVEFFLESIPAHGNRPKGRPGKHKDRIIKEFVRPFDLSRAPLLRAALFATPEGHHLLLVDMHHIISDGVSLEIFESELTALINGRSLSPLLRQYKDFAEWQAKTREKENHKALADFWVNQFSGDIPVLNLPIDFPRPAVQSFAGHTLHFQVGSQDTRALKDLALQENVTLFMLLLAAFNILLFRLSGQEDIVAGTPTAGRPHPDLEPVIGMFVNTLPMRSHPLGNKPLTDYLREIKEIALQVFEHQDFPLEELVDILNIRRDASRNPLFDVMFVLQNMARPTADKTGIKILSREFASYVSKFDLTLYAEESDQALSFEIEYAVKLFRESTIQCWAEYFKNLIASIIQQPQAAIYQLDILSAKERTQLLFDFNDTRAPFPTDLTIPRWFEQQVKKTPRHPALTDIGPDHLTYREMNRRANMLAHSLRKKGIVPDTLVGVMIHRSFNLILAIYAVLKAGGAYLPIDPDYPAERIDYMLTDSGTPILLTHSQLSENISFPGTVICLDDPSLYKDPNTAVNPEPVNQPLDLVYAIYTSGSTGQPKGVLVPIRGFINLVHWYVTEFNIGERDCNILIAPASFDLSQKNLYATLLTGGKLCLAPAGLPNYFELSVLIQRERVTLLNSAPSVFYPLVEFNRDSRYAPLKSLRTVILGGEPIYWERLSGWLMNEGRGCELVNTYGPTECTDIATFYRVKPGDMAVQKSIPLGRPVNNVRLYVLDRYMQVVPLGVIGELCIGGVGISRGYRQNRELTAERFVKTPHLPDGEVYRTGDMVKWLQDGNLDFLGRIDFQVKVRGNRIELGEIEGCLLRLDQVKEAVVTVFSNGLGENILCAYLVGKNGPIDVGKVRAFLSGELPEYIVPTYFMELERFPLTPSGKVDRKALPGPEVTEGEEYVGPRDRVEKQMAGIWAGVLGIDTDKISIDDHFFRLGGDSLKGTIMLSRVHKELGQRLTLGDLFKTPSIRGLCEALGGQVPGEYEEIANAEKNDYYVLSSVQKRLYIINQMEAESIGYNIPAVYRLVEKPDKKMFEQVFRDLIARHESFRTYFIMHQDEPVQRVLDRVGFELEVFRAAGRSGQGGRGGQELIENIIRGFVRPFDLSQAPLLRAALFTTPEGHHLLLVDMHHIISDGVSLEIFESELMALIDSRPLLPVRIQYKDFAEWQAKTREKENHKALADFWVNQFSGDIPVLNLPYDFPRPAVQSFAGYTLHFQVGSEETRALKDLANREGITLFMLLLAAFNILLFRLSGQEDIVAGTPTAGRSHPDLEPVIGMFVNTLPIRSHPLGDKPLTDYLREIKEIALQVFEHQDFPLEELVDILNIRRDASRNPLFDVMFVLQNMARPTAEKTGMKILSREFASYVSKFDLTLYAEETQDGLDFDLEYSTGLFKEKSIARFMAYFKNELSAILAQPHLKIGEIDMISEEEKKLLVDEFNRTEADYPHQLTIWALFAGQVEKTPEKVALKGESIGYESQWTYRSLAQVADWLAGILLDKGMGPGAITTLMLDPGPAMVMAILAVIGAGGCYLPIEPAQPDNRIGHILMDSQGELILTQAALAPRLPGGTSWLDLEETLYTHRQGPGNTSDKGPIRQGTVTDALYLIYTSGTSGQAKGVIIPHQALSNYVAWFCRHTGLTVEDRTMLTSSFSFDLGYTSLYPSLLSGAQLHIVSRGVYTTPDRFVSYIALNRITYLKLTPSLFSLLAAYPDLEPSALKSLRLIVLGGEQIRVSDVKKIHDFLPQVQFINHYGPSEATIGAVAGYIDFSDFQAFAGRPTIGTPIHNTRVYILDRYSHPVPVGVAGELYIGGHGLARGYLNNPELTGERFKNGFYKTGDLCRWLEDGHIEFLGRIDDQVKIRGYRVEPGEIASRLTQHPAVQEAVVLARESAGGEKYLCAYLVARAGKSIETSILQDFLAKNLPDYMVPPYFVFLKKIPLNRNGKIDQRALPEPEVKTGTFYAAPRDEIEKKLVFLFTIVLDRRVSTGQKSPIGIDDNFFELGGHSLKSTILLMKIHKELAVKISLADIFIYPTIRGLAGYIRQMPLYRYQSLCPTEKKEYYPLSSAQKRLYILHQLDPRAVTYNATHCLSLPGEMSTGKVIEAFRHLVARHESLRTSFHLVKDQPVQRIDERVQWGIEEAGPGFIRPFDLSLAPLFRVARYCPDKENAVLILDMHHIISDGVSFDILARDFYAFCRGEGKGLPALAIQYKDFSSWQSREEYQEMLKQQEVFWLEEFRTKPPVARLPVDKPVGTDTGGGFGSGYFEFSLTAEETQGVRKIALLHRSTTYMVLLAVFNILVSRLSGQEDIVIGSLVTGRLHLELEQVTGMFVNTLVLRNYPAGYKRFPAFLAEVTERTLKAFDNQDYPFEELVFRLGIDRAPGTNPLFNVMFVLQHQKPRHPEELEEDFLAHVLDLVDPSSGARKSKFDLTFYCLDNESGLKFTIEYDTAQFDDKSIERLTQYIHDILAHVAKNSDIHLDEILLSHQLWEEQLENPDIAFDI